MLGKLHPKDVRSSIHETAGDRLSGSVYNLVRSRSVLNNLANIDGRAQIPVGTERGSPASHLKPHASWIGAGVQNQVVLDMPARDICDLVNAGIEAAPDDAPVVG